MQRAVGLAVDQQAPQRLDELGTCEAISAVESGVARGYVHRLHDIQVAFGDLTATLENSEATQENIMQFATRFSAEGTVTT